MLVIFRLISSSTHYHNLENIKNESIELTSIIVAAFQRIQQNAYHSNNTDTKARKVIVDFKFDQVCVHRETPEVGLVKKLTGRLY